jgi:hypothetical protein
MPRTAPIVRPAADHDWREAKRVSQIQAELKSHAERLSLSLKSAEPADFDSCRPRTVDFVRTVVENGSVVRYVMRCKTADGRQWLVAKRYSEFDTLKQKLRTLSPVVKALRFPEKTWGSGSSAETVEQRKQELGAWMSSLLTGDGSTDLITGDPEIERELMQFLAPDDSCPVVTPALYDELGFSPPHRQRSAESSPTAATSGWVPSGEWTPTTQQSKVHMEQHTVNARAAALEAVAATAASGGDTTEGALMRHLAEHTRSLGLGQAARAAGRGGDASQGETLEGYDLATAVSELKAERRKRQQLEEEVAELKNRLGPEEQA